MSSHTVVADILEELGYSLQLNRKMLQTGEAHPDRNAQFEFINGKAKRFLKAGIPVISIDAKKKEQAGSFINSGKAYRKSKNPTKVLDHDFPIRELGKMTPYGVYDVSRNTGFVNLGISKDTPACAVESISGWRLTIGKNTWTIPQLVYKVKQLSLNNNH